MSPCHWLAALTETINTALLSTLLHKLTNSPTHKRCMCKHSYTLTVNHSTPLTAIWPYHTARHWADCCFAYVNIETLALSVIWVACLCFFCFIWHGCVFSQTLWLGPLSVLYLFLLISGFLSGQPNMSEYSDLRGFSAPQLSEAQQGGRMQPSVITTCLCISVVGWWSKCNVNSVIQIWSFQLQLKCVLLTLTGNWSCVPSLRMFQYYYFCSEDWGWRVEKL